MPKFHETHRDCGKHEGEGVVVAGLIARKLFELMIAFATVHEQCMKAYSSIRFASLSQPTQERCGFFVHSVVVLGCPTQCRRR